MKRNPEKGHWSRPRQMYSAWAGGSLLLGPGAPCRSGMQLEAHKNVQGQPVHEVSDSALDGVPTSISPLLLILLSPQQIGKERGGQSERGSVEDSSGLNTLARTTLLCTSTLLCHAFPFPFRGVRGRECGIYYQVRGEEVGMPCQVPGDPAPALKLKL